MNKPEQALINWQRKTIRGKTFGFVKAISKDYPRAGVYVVGGIVRDLLLGVPSKDYDFVVTNVGHSALLKFLKKHGKVSLVGKNFGVFKFTPKGTKDIIDIALPRYDKHTKTSGAYRDVKVVSKASVPIEEDLLRRDYTINALAWDVIDHDLIDVSGGLKDLQAKRLRTVGKPEQRFSEDYSRMLRGLRFSATLDFKFEANTWKVLRQKIKQINKKKLGDYIVPREVVAAEFLKSLFKAPIETIRLYDKSDAFSVLMPEVLEMKKCPQPKAFHTEGDVWKHSLLTVGALFSKRLQKMYPDELDVELIFAAFVHDIGKPATLRTPRKHKVNRVRFDGHDAVGAKIATTMIERLKLSSQSSDSLYHVDADNVAWLIKHHLLLLNDNVNKMKATTIEKYFVAHPMSVKLKQLMLADTLASIPASGRPVVSHLKKLEKVISKLPVSNGKLSKPLLTGNEVMKSLKIPAGPKVGKVLSKLREAQLTGKVRNKSEARKLIKQI